MRYGRQIVSQVECSGNVGLVGAHLHTMKRRRLLFGIASVAIAGTITATGHWTLVGRYTDAALIQFLRLRCHYLNLQISDKEFDQFVRLYRKHYGWETRWSTAALEPMAGVFLLSTDFFENGADESIPVRYRRFFHAYVSPCWNPLVRAAKGDSVAG